VEKYSRWAGQFEKQVQEAVLLGMSTRKTARYFSGFFGSALCSAQAISALLRKLDHQVAEFHRSPLADDFEYLFLDGFSLRIRQALRRPYTALVAWGMKQDGSTELLDYKIVTSEKTIFCQSFLEDLFQRGLTGKNLRLIITDGAKGFAEATSWVYPRVPLQSCIVHRLRNVSKYLKRSSNRKTMLQEGKTVFNASDKTQAVKGARAFIGRWQAREPKAVSCFARDLDSSLVFYDQPKELWNKLKSTNPLERLLRELRRRIRLVDSFANLPSADRWMYALTQKIINH
jgi:transposase-like protein